MSKLVLCGAHVYLRVSVRPVHKGQLEERSKHPRTGGGVACTGERGEMDRSIPRGWGNKNSTEKEKEF